MRPLLAGAALQAVLAAVIHFVPLLHAARLFPLCSALVALGTGWLAARAAGGTGRLGAAGRAFRAAGLGAGIGGLVLAALGSAPPSAVLVAGGTGGVTGLCGGLAAGLLRGGRGGGRAARG